MKPNFEQYKDIPGTTIFTIESAREGFHLNQFCMSLRDAKNRERFLAVDRGIGRAGVDGRFRRNIPAFEEPVLIGRNIRHGDRIPVPFKEAKQIHELFRGLETQQ